jgi:hypothetical protein
LDNPLANSVRVLESHWKMPKYRSSANRRDDRIARQQSAKMWQYLFIFPEVLHLSVATV